MQRGQVSCRRRRPVAPSRPNEAGHFFWRNRSGRLDGDWMAARWRLDGGSMAARWRRDGHPAGRPASRPPAARLAGAQSAPTTINLMSSGHACPPPGGPQILSSHFPYSIFFGLALGRRRSITCRRRHDRCVSKHIGLGAPGLQPAKLSCWSCPRRRADARPASQRRQAKCHCGAPPKAGHKASATSCRPNARFISTSLLDLGRPQPVERRPPG